MHFAYLEEIFSLDWYKLSLAAAAAVDISITGGAVAVAGWRFLGWRAESQPHPGIADLDRGRG